MMTFLYGALSPLHMNKHLRIDIFHHKYKMITRYKKSDVKKVSSLKEPRQYALRMYIYIYADSTATVNRRVKKSKKKNAQRWQSSLINRVAQISVYIYWMQRSGYGEGVRRGTEGNKHDAKFEDAGCLTASLCTRATKRDTRWACLFSLRYVLTVCTRVCVQQFMLLIPHSC